LLLVSHDRAFLDNVVTQTIAAEGDGVCANTWVDTATGYGSGRRRAGAAAARQSAATAQAVAEPAATRRKLSYKELRELESLPGNIEKLEQETTPAQ
jgi:ATP-binding cassette subfamily F protein uup